MSDFPQIDKAVEAATDQVVADAIAYVKAHPDYGRIVSALGEGAINVLKGGLGI